MSKPMFYPAEVVEALLVSLWSIVCFRLSKRVAWKADDGTTGTTDLVCIVVGKLDGGSAMPARIDSTGLPVPFEHKGAFIVGYDPMQSREKLMEYRTSDPFHVLHDMGYLVRESTLPGLQENPDDPRVGAALQSLREDFGSFEHPKAGQTVFRGSLDDVTGFEFKAG